MLAHIVLLELLDERHNALIMCGFRWELDALLRERIAVERAELFVVCNVEEVDVLLEHVSGNLMAWNQGMKA